MKWLTKAWNWIRHPFPPNPVEPPPVKPPPVGETLLGIKLKMDEQCPKDEAFLVSSKDAVRIIGIDPAQPGSEMAASCIWEYIEGTGEAKIISMSMWTEGHKCSHSYQRVNTSKEHKEAMQVSGTHKDYLCTKCGHSYCAVVSDDAKEVSNGWASIVGEKKV